MADKIEIVYVSFGPSRSESIREALAMESCDARVVALMAAQSKREVDPMLRGQCHCGEVSFQVPDHAVASSICYCNDCRQQSGAPMLA